MIARRLMDRATVVLLITLFVVPGSVTAQEICEDEETLSACWRRYSRAFDDDASSVEDSVFRQTDRRLSAKTAGLAGALGAGLGSAIDDFLPAFAGGLVLDRLEDEGNDAGFGFDFNLPTYHQPGVPLQYPNLHGTVRLRLEIREPRAFAPLLETVPEAQRNEVRDELERGLHDFNDLTLGLTWNGEGRSVGRSVRSNADVVDELLSTFMGEVARPSLTFFLAEWEANIEDNIRADRASASECDVLTELNPRMDCLKPDFRGGFEQAIRESALARRAYRMAVDDRLRDAGFYRLPDLLNNQPQFNLSFKARFRVDELGPNEFSFRARYENGFANLNGLRKFCDGAVGTSCYQRYLADPGVQARLRDSDRFWFAAELHFVEDYRFADLVLADSVLLALGQSVSLKGELGFGRYLGVDESGQEFARLDLLLQGELHEKDAGRRDRWAISTVYTQRISDVLSLPLGLKFSNKHEFLNDIDERISANFGLQYRLRRKPPSPPDS